MPPQDVETEGEEEAGKGLLETPEVCAEKKRKTDWEAELTKEVGGDTVRRERPVFDGNATPGPIDERGGWMIDWE